MIPYTPSLPATVIAYANGRFIGQRYGHWQNLGQIREMVLREKWMAPGKATRYDVVQDGNYLMKFEVDMEHPDVVFQNPLTPDECIMPMPSLIYIKARRSPTLL